MAEENNKNPGIFQKVLEAGSALLDAQIIKAKTSIINSNIEDDFLYSKTITEDPNYSTHAQGWLDKPFRIQNSHLKQMSTQDSIIAAVIQTRQNQVSAHSKLVKASQEKGFMIELVDEESLLAKIKEELAEEVKAAHEEKKAAGKIPGIEPEGGESESGDDPADDIIENPSDMVEKAETEDPTKDAFNDGPEEDEDENSKSDDEVEITNWELERKAREKLQKQFADAKKKVEQWVLNCGLPDNRPFLSKRWNFDSALRAWSRDTLTYDLYSTEMVPDKVGRPHHWFPVDGGTIKYASHALKNYKDMAETFINLDILYPENTKVAEDKQKAIDLKPELLAKDAYKYVQVIRGKVERAYTPDELKVGIRNSTTDIFVNGYGISELELLVSLVTGHLNAEYYNQAYFTQGFSAKGILHIKAAINRRKLESVRQQWQHMLKGARNSFQTPIFAGVDEVKWIPLTQNHNDIGFEGWMRYLTTLICAIYQIDPAELGIYFKQEGGGSGGMHGDNTHEKLSESKDKGLYPLMRHIEGYINENIIKPYDARFCIKFTGLSEETKKSTIERQEKEVKFKKSVNEVRAEDGLPPIPGCDDVILDTNYMTWFTNFSPKGQALQKQKADQQAKLQKDQMEHQSNLADKKQDGEEDKPEQEGPDVYKDGMGLLGSAGTPPLPDVKKSEKSKKISVEVYNIKS